MAERIVYWRRSVVTDLVIGSTLLLVSIASMLAWHWLTSRTHDRDAALASLTQTAQSIAVGAGDQFEEGISLGRALASEEEVQARDPALFRPLLERQAALHPRIRDLAVIDLDGTVLGRAASGESAGESVRERGFFQRVTRLGEPTTIRELMPGSGSTFSTGVAVPIRADDDSLVGVLTLMYDLSQFEDRLAQIDLQPGQSLALLDPNGRIAVLMRDPSQPSVDLTWDQRDRSSLPEVQAALLGQTRTSASLTSALNGDTRLGAFVPTPRYGWTNCAA